MVDLNRLTMIYSNSPEANDKSWDYHKIDPDSIKEINDKYFINNPIDIIKLYNNPPELLLELIIKEEYICLLKPNERYFKM